ncbi:MAG: peptidylprolyl isomerase [Vicingaceae bacterium]
MKKSIIWILGLMLVSNFQALAQEKQVFIDFGDEEITKADFKRVYLKNNSGDMVTKSSVEEYLDLYLNFKLKVKEAEARGLDTVSSFVNELKGYRKQLAQPYLSADGVMEDLKKEAYQRLQEEVRASHILIAAQNEDSPEDTLKAYKKALKVKEMLEKGENFEKVAKQYSDDPSAEKNGGDLGYFTAFYMVYPFESAAYNTKEGEVSEIVKTRFGYHVLKIMDRRPASGNMKAAHILISSDPELSKTDDPEAKIREIYEKLESGESFETLARQFSDDLKSAERGGQLPTFGIGRMVKPFEDAAFALETDGDYSEPFQTQYGWHIVKRISKDEIGAYDEVETELSQRVKKDSRSNLTEGALIKKIKKDYGFTEKLKERDDFYDLIDTAYFNGNWSADQASKLKKTIFTIGDQEVTQQDFAKYLESSMRARKPIDQRVLVNNRYKRFKRQQLLDYKDSKLEEEEPEFKALMEEYHDGILLFNLTDELVWSKAVEDSAGLAKFYENNKENYRWEQRVDAVVYSALNEKLVNKTKKLIKDGLQADSIQKLMNEDSQLNLKYETKKYEKGDHDIVDQIEWKKGVSKTIEKNNRIYFVEVKEVLVPTYKTLEDARGIIASDYQNHLEKEWVKSLREKYDYTVNQELLKELKAELE